MSSLELLPAWQKEMATVSSPDAEVTHLAYQESPAGLKVTVTRRRFTAFLAVEWVVDFENLGPADSPVLEEILPLDLALVFPPEERLRLHHANGSLCQMDDFLPQVTELRPGSKKTLAPIGGALLQRRLPLHELAARRLRPCRGSRLVGTMGRLV